MAEQRHGRYYAQELVLDRATSKREQIQDALAAGDSRQWHLVGVADGLVEGVVLLFWDTAWPQVGSFAGQRRQGFLEEARGGGVAVDEEDRRPPLQRRRTRGVSSAGGCLQSLRRLLRAGLDQPRVASCRSSIFPNPLY